jgi:hypothetical protein
LGATGGFWLLGNLKETSIFFFLSSSLVRHLLSTLLFTLLVVLRHWNAPPNRSHDDCKKNQSKYVVHTKQVFISFCLLPNVSLNSRQKVISDLN